MKLIRQTIFGETLGWRLRFNAGERALLAAAMHLAEEARRRCNPTRGDAYDEGADTTLAGIEHGCRALLEEREGLRVEQP